MLSQTEGREFGFKLATVTTAFVIVVFSIALIFLQGWIGERQDNSLLASCRGGNLRSGYELANKSDGPERAQLAHDALPIIDCEKLVFDSERVAVPLSVQKEYVRILVEDRRWPIINDGVITHTETLPGVARSE